MATNHSTSELDVHLTQHGGTMIRRMLTFIHNSFSGSHLCGFHPGEMSGLAHWPLMWKPLTLKSGQGQYGHVYCNNVQHKGLFAFSFLLSPLGPTCGKGAMLQFKDASVRWRYFIGLFCRKRAGHVENVGCFIWVVFEKVFAPYVGLMPESAFFFKPS